MSLRHLLYTILMEDLEIQAVYDERVIDSGALGEPEGLIPPFPFLVTQWGNQRPGWGTVEDRQVELWSYDSPTDYTRTEKGLWAVQQSLDRRAGDSLIVEDRRTWLIEARLESISRDMMDDVLRASVKYATYRMVGNSEAVA